jgi:Fe-S oxidoreductase
MVPPGDVFGVVPIWVFVYLAAAVGFGLHGYLLKARVFDLIALGRGGGVVKALMVLATGTPEQRAEMRVDRPLERVKGVLLVVLGQRKVLQSISLHPKTWDLAGLGHAVIFWGFLSFVLSYVLFMFIDPAWAHRIQDPASPDRIDTLSESVLSATGMKVFVWYIDIFAVAIMAAVVWALIRRWVITPSRLKFDLTQHPDAVFIVGHIFLEMALTLLVEGMNDARIRLGDVERMPQGYAPMGMILGKGFVNMGIDVGLANDLQAIFWWLRTLSVFEFAAYIPHSKHLHTVASPLNAFFRDLKPRGYLPPIRNIEEAESFGAGKVADLTWKELLDGYACAVCGRCTDSCPANLSGKPLSPMHIVENIKEHLMEVGPSLVAGKSPSTGPTSSDSARSRSSGQAKADGDGHKPLMADEPGKGAILTEAVWNCVTCGACERECPVMVEHIDSIMDMRRNLVMEQSKMPPTAEQTLRSLEQRGHPWRGTKYTRDDWFKDLGVKTLAEDPEVEVLFWVGCTPALEERSRAIAVSMVKILKSAGVKFGVLGSEEVCSGDPARRIGNEYLFQLQAQQNVDTFKKYNVKKVLTVCPHCFNTIKNEYPDFGGTYEVLHYSQFIAQLMQQGKLKGLKPLNVSVAYHDSCYLGRHNNVYEEPREVLGAIPGVRTQEMHRHHERSFCCGAGGGHMWVEESSGRRINHLRTEQFLDTGAQVVGVSCPFCLQMMEEGITAKNVQDKVKAKDVVELLAESLGEG